MQLKVQGISSAKVRDIQPGGYDANSQKAQTHVAKWLQNPCRHCLQLIAEGDEKLVLSYRPFDKHQPYAETGPIFLHKKVCDHYSSNELPGWFIYLDPAIIRGYDSDHLIRYETGDVVPSSELAEACKKILSDKSIAYVHIRSKYNCFQCQVERD